MTLESAAPGKTRGRKKGTPKTGGRRKGTPNRNSLSVLGALDRAGCPVIEFLVRDIQTLEPKERIPEWKALLAFCYPKLKDIETGERAQVEPASPPALAGFSTSDLISLVRSKPAEQKANA